MNERINLLEPNKNTGASVFLRRLQTARVVTVGLLFIISASSVILFIMVALSPLPTLQRQEQSLQQTLAQSKSDIVKLALVDDQTSAVSKLLTKRNTLDVPLGLILDKLSGDMKVTDIRTDNKSVQVTVESSSLQSLDSFLNGVITYVQEKKTFSKATLIELTVDSSSNAYVATVQLNLL